MSGRWRAIVCAAAALGASAAGQNAADAPLADAIQRQDRPAVQTLLDQKADVNAALADGSTALLWAVHWDDLALAGRLLRAGANVSAANGYGISPILEASETGDAALMEALLNAGADANTAQPEGETALMTASRTGNADAVKALLNHGAQVNAREKWRGQTALMWAAAERHPAVVQLLIEHGADVDARSSAVDFTDLQPTPGSVPMNYPRGGFTALLFAARQGDLESGRALVNAEAGVNLGDPDGTTPLIEAIVNSHFDFAVFLLDHGADPNACDGKGRSPLYAAVDMHTVDTSTRPNLRSAGTSGSLDAIKSLLEHGANANAQLIDVLAPRGPLDVADYSMGSGATPFLRAAKADDLEVMRLLLAKGANPNLETSAHVTALMAAAGIGWRDGKSHGTDADAVEAVKLCLRLGADLNATNDKGETALHGAAQRDAPPVIAYLVGLGADKTIRDRNGLTALGGEKVQNFTAPASALGTSTGGFAPSVPAVVQCEACAGTFTATSSAPWVVIASSSGGSVGFNVFTNTSSAPRSAAIQILGSSNAATLVINQAPSTAPTLNRKVAYLYQQILGREPDATGFAAWVAQGPAALSSAGANLLDTAEARDSDFLVLAMHQALLGSAPGYSTYLAALRAIRTGTTPAAQFEAIRTRGACPRTLQETVECLYRNLLDRAPTTSELSSASTRQPFAVFLSLLASPEFQSTGGFTTDHTNSLFATMLYYLILQRDPDPAGLAAAVTVANTGGAGIYSNHSPAQLLILGDGQNSGLTGSAEFLSRFQ